MPKKRGKKNTFQNQTRKILYPDLEFQIIGYVERALGSRFFQIKCLDAKERRCKARNKRVRINKDDYVIVSLREFDDKNGDIIHKYNRNEILQLKKEGYIPTNFDKQGLNNLDKLNGDDDCAFEFSFEDI